jgi:hypothetical protein
VMGLFVVALWITTGGAFLPSAQMDATTVTRIDANPLDFMMTCLWPLKSTV